MEDIHIAATVKHQVYEIIKKRIIEQYYKPGQWLQENDVASQLNVGRSPVRAALKSLVHDGLVIELPNKGVFVREFSQQDIRDIFDMRSMMESYAIAGSSVRRPDSILNTLEKLLGQLVEAHKQGDLKHYTKYDTQLHDAIIALSGNALLSSAYHQLRSMLQPFRVYSLLEKGRFDDSVEEHRRIVGFIASGDVEKAIEVNKEHLTLSRDVILNYLSAKEK